MFNFNNKKMENVNLLNEDLFLSIKENDSIKLKKLIESGADINLKNIHNNTPLHIACSKNMIEICKILIESKADINATNANGDSPLDIAIYWKNYQIEFLLIQNGGVSYKKIKGEKQEYKNDNAKSDIDFGFLFWFVIFPIIALGLLAWTIYSGGWLAIIAILLIILILK